MARSLRLNLMIAAGLFGDLAREQEEQRLKLQEFYPKADKDQRDDENRAEAMKHLAKGHQRKSKRR